MPSAQKKTSKVSTTTTAPTIPVPPPVPPTPVSETVTTTSTKTTKQSKASSKKESVKEATKPVITPIEDQVVATTEEVNTIVATDVTSGVSANFSEFYVRLQKLISEFGSLRTDLKMLEKRTMKELKVVNKINNKRKKKGTARAPSGFVKPTKISDELATFLGRPFGSEMARTDVTREINAYIRAHSLQDKTNGRKIIPDSELAKLLKVTDNDELTYFNLQRYMSPHFTKKAALESTA